MYRRMHTMNVYMAKVSFPERRGYKYRPVVYLEQHKGIATVLRVTSSFTHCWIKTHYYYPIDRLHYAGLYKRSYIDMSCPSHMEIRMLKQRIGILDIHDRIKSMKFGLIEHKLYDKPSYKERN